MVCELHFKAITLHHPLHPQKRKENTICYITVNDDDGGRDVDRCTLTLLRIGYKLPRDIT